MKPTQVYGDARKRHRAPALGVIRPVVITEPQHVLYRGRVRRVRGVIVAQHQGHRYYVLTFKRGHAPRDAHLAVIGPRGQRHVTGVVVRSDHLVPLRRGVR